MFLRLSLCMSCFSVSLSLPFIFLRLSLCLSRFSVSLSLTFMFLRLHLCISRFSVSLSAFLSIPIFFSLHQSISLSLFASIYILLLTPFPSIYLSNYLSFSSRKSLKRFKEYARGNIGMFGSRNFFLESYLRGCFHFGINCVGSLGQNGKRRILSFSQNVRSRVPNVHHHLWALLVQQILNL